MKTIRRFRFIVLIAGLLFIAVVFACQKPSVAPSADTSTPTPDAPASVMAVAVPSRGGAVDGTTQKSDEFIWNLFTQIAAPVVKSQPSPVTFETWATDEDTYSKTPHWPGPNEPKKFHRSLLDAATAPVSVAKTTAHAQALDVQCSTPGNASVGGFPTTGPPTPCIAEEVNRNRAQYDYIVNNGLNTKAGLATAYKNSFKVAMPTDAVAVKADWVPVQTMLQWMPQLGDVANIEKLYYTTTAASVEYAMVGMHVSSRQNTNWVWATFEHQMNPGRCDTIGCFDSFGAAVPAVLPNKSAANTQYGACAKSPALQTLMTNAGLSPVWANYCLKSTEVDYAAADGTPYVLGNSVVERINANVSVAAASCIACHVYASFGPTGAPTAAAGAMLGYNPTGQPIPAALNGSIQNDFMWGVLAAP